MWCWHQLQQRGIPTLPDHPLASKEDPEKISVKTIGENQNDITPVKENYSYAKWKIPWILNVTILYASKAIAKELPASMNSGLRIDLGKTTFYPNISVPTSLLREALSAISRSPSQGNDALLNPLYTPGKLGKRTTHKIFLPKLWTHFTFFLYIYIYIYKKQKRIVTGILQSETI